MPSEALPVPLLTPAWLAQVPGIGAGMSTREGGVSSAPWDSLNLGRGCGDDLARVDENRRRFEAALGAGVRCVWLRQVHGIAVRQLTAADLEADAPDPPADAAWTTEPGIACTAMAADCLPVLFAARDGSVVAAPAGVLEATLAAVERGTGVPADAMLAWLGPCIGPQSFEVGGDVLAAFGVAATAGDATTADGVRFTWAPWAYGSPRWRADLPGLAAARLQRSGVRHLARSDRCTVAEASAFFSFRRDGVTGRMAAAIWRRGG
jgi:polyphenol oxidase